MSLFVGRTSELAQLDEMARNHASFVTLWGPPGAGKTRLAREHVKDSAAIWVDLAASRSRDDVVTAIASALGAAIEERDDAVATIVRAAAAQHATLIADNVEQIDHEGREVLVAIARDGEARVVATSREVLGVPGEKTIAVGPLDEEDALSLFRALGGAGDEQATRAIVKRLDAVPLAIELAAARVPVLGVEELRVRLDKKLDVLGPSLRATVAWSWELLEPKDQLALAACATFEAPFDAALAEAVMPLGDVEGLDALERLRQRALVQAGAPDARGRPTLRLLETVRELVRELSPHDLARRHGEAIVARCLPLAEDVARGSAVPAELVARRADLGAVVRRVQDTPIVSARAALALAIVATATGPLDTAIAAASAGAAAARDHDPSLAARLDLTAAEALRAIGRANEGLALAERAAEHGGTLALRVRGAIKRAVGDVEGAIADIEAALARFRAEGDRAREAACLGELGAALQSKGRLADARARHAEAIAIHVALGTRRAEGLQRSYLAVATHRAGDCASAIALHERALAIHREVGSARLEGAEELHLGFVHHETGSPGRARAALEEARTVLARSGARGLEAFALVLAARVDADENDHASAMVRLAEAGQCAPAGWARLEATRRVVEGHLATARGDARAAADAYRAALAASKDVEVGFEALTPAYLAFALARLGDAEEAAQSFDVARARVAAFENPWLPIALAVLEGRSGATEEAIASSSEVRRALAFAGTRRSLRVTADAAHVVLPDGRELDLSRRKNVRLILRALVDARRTRPGEALDPDALVAAGWPGERMRADAATKRLHTAVWTLRSLGLGDVLLTDERGYRLDPSIPVDIFERL